MKTSIAILATFITAAFPLLAASYSTEATITQHNEQNTYEVIVRVAHLVEKDGKLTEELVARPKIQAGLGTPASMYVGLQPTHLNYQNEDNVTVDVSWLKAGDSGTAFCSVTVRRGDKVVSKSKLQLKVEGK
ncbi:MAG: hypothetical protein QOF48_3755 [Verrucomicrobiota bacterium]